MKKIALIILGALLLGSCSRDFLGSDYDWSGTYSGSEYAGYDYMMCVADNLIVDNLKQMETALAVEKRNTGISTRFEMDGSLWTVGSEWTVSQKSSLLAGLKIKRAAADSTWTLTRNDKYSFNGNEFVTDYEMDVRMHPDTTSRASDGHFWWDVTLKKCSRNEDLGYRSEITTPSGSKLEYTYGSMNSWAYCFGILDMVVYKDDQPIDVARLQITGGRYNNTYLRNL